MTCGHMYYGCISATLHGSVDHFCDAFAHLGEELGEKGDAKTAEWAWVLDPIDGTKSFITGEPAAPDFVFARGS